MSTDIHLWSEGSTLIDTSPYLSSPNITSHSEKITIWNS